MTLTKTNWKLGCLALCLLLLSNLSFGASQKLAKKLPAMKSAPSLGKIDGESDKKMSAVNIRFDKEPRFSGAITFEDHGSFLQIPLAGIVVPNPGQFFDGNSPYIKKIAAFQLTPNDAAIRLFVSEKASAIKNAVKADLLGKRIIVTLDHAKVKSEVAAAKASNANTVIAATKVDKSIPAPATLLKNDASKEALAVGSGVQDLRGRMVGVAIFSGVMLLCLLILYVLRPYLRKRTVNGKKEPAIDMKTLATLPLAAKQKLSLIQVGPEKILVGVTPENINFITSVTNPSTNIRAPQKPQAMPMALHQANESTIQLQPQPKPQPTVQNSSPKTTRKPASEQIVEKPAPTKKRGATKIDLAVGDEGVVDNNTKPTPDVGNGKNAIDDVTRLIREKLKNLPPV